MRPIEAAQRVLDEDRSNVRPDKRILSADAEVGLSVLLRGGPRRIGVEPTAEEISALPRDDLRRRAYDCLVLHNQRLAWSYVKGFIGQGLEDEDLFQHGMLGVMRAARKFDPAMGYKFSTYASNWIRQSMSRAVADEGAAIRIPVHMHETMRKVARVERELQRAGRPRRVADVAVAADLSVRQVEEIRRISRVTDSLDREIGEGVNLGDLIGERWAAPSVVEAVLALLEAEELAALLARLTEREALVIRRRAGVFGEEEATLDEIGKDLGVTRERIRQIESKAYYKLRGYALERQPERGEPNEPARSVETKQPIRTVSEVQTTPSAKTIQQAPDVVKHKAPVPPAPEEYEGEPVVLDVDDAPPYSRWDIAVARHTLWKRDEPWILEYARLALGDVVLDDILGSGHLVPARLAVARGRAVPVLTAKALRTLAHVLECLQTTGRRPEEFFETPQAATSSLSPRQAVREVELVSAQGRELLTNALDAFLKLTPSAGPVPEAEPSSAPVPVADPAPVPEPVTQETPVPQRNDTPEVPAPHAPAPADAPYQGWTEACQLPQTLDRNVHWMSGYVLLALGPAVLADVLGADPARAVADASERKQLLDRPVVLAVEVLMRVLNGLRARELRPEDFFESFFAASLGMTPRAYLSEHTLVKPDGRLAVSQAFDAFLSTRPSVTARVPVSASPTDGPAPTTVTPPRPATGGRASSAPMESDLSRAAEERYERRPLETRAQYERRLRETCEQYERRLRTAEEGHEHRLGETREHHGRQLREVREQYEQRLRATGEEAGQRVSALEERLRAAEAAFAEQEEAGQLAEQTATARVQAAEQWARQRVTEVEQAAQARVAEAEQAAQAAQARVAELEERVKPDPAPSAPPPPAESQGPDPRKWWRRR
ncbi:sigma-70 family RNA polymerase sigma factor [Streptomyces sp. NPDC056224]|uniref:sigma-70 family RNA polymerase sigma factor n=1 Tax=Streptomyces sp. NPDC056224 TaxID=3345750 RepID=UPI0035DFC481